MRQVAIDAASIPKDAKIAVLEKTSAKALDAVFQIEGVQVCGRVNLGLVEDVRLWIRL